MAKNIKKRLEINYKNIKEIGIYKSIYNIIKMQTYK